MLHRKHYRELAKILRETREEATYLNTPDAISILLDHLEKKLCNFLEENNINFDRRRFLKECRR